MANLRKLCIVSMTMLAAATTFATSVLGTWHGKTDFSSAKVPQGQDRRMYEQFKKSMEALRVDITFKADKTYTVSYTVPGSKTPSTSKGKWSQKGQTISIVDSGQHHALKVSADGKSLIMAPEGGMGAKMVFKR